GLVAFGGVLAIASVARIERRIPDYRSPVTFTASAVRDYPSGPSLGELAVRLRGAGEIDVAMERFHQALAASPPAFEICEAYADTPLVLRDDRKALEVTLETIERHCPGSPGIEGR